MTRKTGYMMSPYTWEKLSAALEKSAGIPGIMDRCVHIEAFMPGGIIVDLDELNRQVEADQQKLWDDDA
ncbi:MAG: hypothetical protein GY923_15310 [Aestuariibacter sp.]|nr:hypothetical protein [Aestuariibacter sp.]